MSLEQFSTISDELGNKFHLFDLIFLQITTRIVTTVKNQTNNLTPTFNNNLKKNR